MAIMKKQMQEELKQHADQQLNNKMREMQQKFEAQSAELRK